MITTTSTLVREIAAVRARETITRLADFGEATRHAAEQLRAMGRSLTTPRCSLCGALENLDLIAAHNIRCANGGERSYAMPLVIGERRAPSIELAPRHPAFTRLLEAR
jgi:hypothetical protein